ncbi:hypothetical protein AB0M54_24465 [Actinoplanes sp. NPDC051470]|uniref:hypothetical protein n=1 Tax=Actinoplanes sp. NPDC051470 TaxID=3157224 RepID=UPI003446DB30
MSRDREIFLPIRDPRFLPHPATAGELRLVGELGSALSRLTVLEKRCAELEQVEAQRDRFIAAADKLHDEWLDLKAEVAQAVGLAGDYARERDAACAELASARQEIARVTRMHYELAARYADPGGS